MNPYRQLPQILFSFGQQLTIGAYSVSFLSAYFTFNEVLFVKRQSLFLKYLPAVWAVALLITGIRFFYLRREVMSEAERSVSRREFNNFAVFLAGLTVAGLLQIVQLNFKFIYLAVFLAAIYSLSKNMHLITFESRRPAWLHPTTAGLLLQGTIALACICGLAVFGQSPVSLLFSWTLLVVLLLEALTIWSRFRFLSRTSLQTRHAAEMMLGTHLTLFGIRFIFGVAMPLVFLVWSLLFAPLPWHPVILMVAVGELSERILFYITAGETVAGQTAGVTEEH